MNRGPILEGSLRGAITAAATSLLATIPQQPKMRAAAFFFGPYGVRLRFSSEALERELLPQFGHSIGEAPSDLTIHGAESPIELGRLEQAWARFGLPPGHTSTTIRQGQATIHVEFDDDGLASLFVLDNEKSVAVFAAASARRVKPLEGAYPLMLLLRLWSERTPHLWTHGAVVGNENAGVLITGVAGAGKSSTSIAVAGGKLRLLGDDYVLIGSDRIAWSIYSTVRARHDMVERLRAAGPWFDDDWFEWKGKPSQILKADKYRFLGRRAQLKAIVMPRHHCEDGPSFHRVSPARALHTIVPVTITRHYANPPARLELLTNIVQSLPVYEFHTVPDLARMREPFERFVESL